MQGEVDRGQAAWTDSALRRRACPESRGEDARLPNSQFPAIHVERRLQRRITNPRYPRQVPPSYTEQDHRLKDRNHSPTINKQRRRASRKESNQSLGDLVNVGSRLPNPPHEARPHRSSHPANNEPIRTPRNHHARSTKTIQVPLAIKIAFPGCTAGTGRSDPGRAEEQPPPWTAAVVSSSVQPPSAGLVRRRVEWEVILLLSAGRYDLV